MSGGLAENSRGVALTPERDIDVVDGHWIATSSEPWLTAGQSGLFPAGAHVEIRYRLGVHDDPVRPILRFWTVDGPVDRLLPGPVAGAGIWDGRVPEGATRVSISPVNRSGRFDFRLESVVRVSSARLIARGFRKSPGDALGALACRAIGYGPEYERNLGWATGFTPLKDYAEWKAVRRRPIELDGIDAPRADPASAPLVWVTIDALGAAPVAVEATIRSLVAQTHHGWRAFCLGHATSFVGGDARLLAELPTAASARLPALALSIKGGDILASEAFSCLVEYNARFPMADFIYADEEFAGADGRLWPRFKPAWSPSLQSAAPYTGRMIAAVARDTAIFATLSTMKEIAPPPDAATERVGRVKRVLMRAGEPYPPARAVAAPHFARQSGAVSIVIPSKERLSLLKPCLDTVLALTEAKDFEVVVVDNGSVERATLAYYDELEKSDRAVRVLRSPGPFNFSLLCNEGARAARPDADVLVFLNNDTEALRPDWLDRLAARAREPGVGAVGGKLLFPDGDVQHIDLVLGLQGDAGLIDRRAQAEAPGWLSRNIIAHECSAVAAACLAVTREKFNAIGGFDEELRVELNDVDICLRLAARGWRCLSDPSVVLLHREGASRGGASLQRISKHGGDRASFFRRWGRIDRDDPFFHPGFSLERLAPSLS